MPNDTPQNGLTIREAITLLEKQFKTGAYQNVIDGCRDILQIDPKNKAAGQLLKKALQKTTPTPHINKTSIKIGAGILICVLIISGIIWYTNRSTKPIITHDRTTDNSDDNTPAGKERKVHNQQRLTDLKKIENALLEAYKRDHKYPDATTLTETLMNGGFIDAMPSDPLNGTKTNDGNTFTYMYAVYDNVKGLNQEYILSGIFEESDGTNIIWTLGAKIIDHPDYRDDTLDNVTTIE